MNIDTYGEQIWAWSEFSGPIVGSPRPEVRATPPGRWSARRKRALIMYE
jgi:DMSO/TMAO reductase YedYZ molybdopterin-dependent catalytic subunit